MWPLEEADYIWIFHKFPFLEHCHYLTFLPVPRETFIHKCSCYIDTWVFHFFLRAIANGIAFLPSVPTCLLLLNRNITDFHVLTFCSRNLRTHLFVLRGFLMTLTFFFLMYTIITYANMDSFILFFFLSIYLPCFPFLDLLCWLRLIDQWTKIESRNVPTYSQLFEVPQIPRNNVWQMKYLLGCWDNYIIT